MGEENRMIGVQRMLALALSLLLVVGLILPAQAKLEETQSADFDGYLVGLSEPVGAQLFSGRAEEELRWVTEAVCWVPTRAAARELERQGLAEYVEPNYVATLFQDTEPDASVGITWNNELIAAEVAADYGLDGDGIRIGIIDSGVDAENPDLSQAKIGVGYDYLEETEEMCDTVYHGTMIAQTIAGDRNTLGQTGVAPGAEIIPLRCFSQYDGGTVEILSKAIRDAVDVYDCDIISMSWGFNLPSETLYAAVRHAWESGALLVAAAGNVNEANGFPQGTLAYPACYEEVLSVSSVNAEKTVAQRTQINEHVFVSAPGENLTGVWANGRTTLISGTSFSTPQVAAALAILLQLAPELDAEAVFDLLKTRSMDVMTQGYDPETGYGLLRFDNLLNVPWSGMHQEEQPNAARFFGWYPALSDSQVILTGYQANEKMVRTTVLPGTSGLNTFDAVFDTTMVDLVRIFYLGQDCTPLDAPDKHPLPEQ